VRGKRLYDTAPQSHWHTTTMICSMRLDGSTACMAIEGPTNTELFRPYVRRVFCPTLRAGDVVIMDNLSPHKSAETLCLIQQLGANVLFLPAYCPDLNPIEKMWSKLKESLRSAQARSQPALIQAIGSALAAITPQHAMNWVQ
jgi:transposase